jgi:hypothetical protein
MGKWESNAIVQKLRSTNFVNTFNNQIGSMKFRNNGTNTIISQWFASKYTIHNIMRFFHNWLTLLSQSVPRKFIWTIYGFYAHHLDKICNFHVPMWIINLDFMKMDMYHCFCGANTLCICFLILLHHKVLSVFMLSRLWKGDRFSHF